MTHSILIVVRRDASGTFQHLQAMLAETRERQVAVLWDRRTRERRRPDDSVIVERRTGERRAEAEWVFLDERRQRDRRERPESRQPERRQAERRRRTPGTWRTLGFVLVPQNPPAGNC